MKIIKPYFEIETEIDGEKILKNIEKIGRTCYKSENLITNDSAAKFVKMLINRGHEAMIEHESITVRVICDRGIMAEITRHRIFSFAIESTRFCKYNKAKFGNELTFIEPCFWGNEKINMVHMWYKAMSFAEQQYMELIKAGATAQEARSILPNSLKTEIVMTANLREWRHFFKLRTASEAHPQMREIAIPMLTKFKELIPVVFDDLEV